MVFVACTVWHVIPTSEAILKCQIVVVLAGGKEMQIATAMYVVTQFSLPHFHLICK